MTKPGHITASMTRFSFVCMCVLFFCLSGLVFGFVLEGGLQVQRADVRGQRESGTGMHSVKYTKN